jgi:chromosomal replication initiation ATPase DnaA
MSVVSNQLGKGVEAMPAHIYAIIDYNSQMLYRRRAFQKIIYYSDEEVKASAILKCVCDTMGVTIDQIKGRRRLRKYVEARHLFYYICRTETILPLYKTGEFVNRNHATVIYGANTMRVWAEYDKQWCELVETIKLNSGCVPT